MVGRIDLLSRHVIAVIKPRLGGCRRAEQFLEAQATIIAQDVFYIHRAAGSTIGPTRDDLIIREWAKYKINCDWPNQKIDDER